MGNSIWTNFIAVVVVACVFTPSSVSQLVTKYNSCESLQVWTKQVLANNPNPLWRVKE